MDPHMRYYQGNHGGYGHEYYVGPSWREWPGPPLPASATLSRPPRRRRSWAGLLGAALAFTVIATVIAIAGFAIYMGALKLEGSHYMVLEGSFRVISGDSYNEQLSDHSSERFNKKSQVYRLMIESIFRRTDLSPAIKQFSILRFTNGSLVVFFRLILDRRKIPKKYLNIEEQVRASIIQGVPIASPVKSLKIDKNNVFIKRVRDDISHSTTTEYSGDNNQTIEIHNGIMRKTFPKTVSPNLSAFNRPKQQSTTPKSNIIEGSFKLLTSEAPIKAQTSRTPTYTNRPVSSSPKSSHENQNKNENSKGIRSDISPSVDFFQHSPALNELLQKSKTEKGTSTVKTTSESVNPSIDYRESGLMTLLPYVFQGQDEPWRPLLPENFTRYPERRPITITTEDYSSVGVGIVEVVLEPDEVVPSKQQPLNGFGFRKKISTRPSLKTSEPSTGNIKAQINFVRDDVGLNTGLKEIVVPKSKIDLLTTNKEPIYNDESKVAYTDNKMRSGSSFSDFLPDFPIVQQFHNLDSFLRSYNSKTSNSPSSSQTSPQVPVTLLPARSNLDIKKQVRPRPSPTPQDSSGDILLTDVPDTTQYPSKLIRDQIVINISPPSESNPSFVELFDDNSRLPEGNEPDRNPAESNINAGSTEIMSVDLLRRESIPKPNLGSESYSKGFDSTVTTVSYLTDLAENTQSDSNFEMTEKSFPSQFETSSEYKTTLDQSPAVLESEYPDKIKSQIYRISKMSERSSSKGNPLNIDMQDYPVDTSISSDTNDTSVSNIKLPQTKDEIRLEDLKHGKVEELLEKIIYNQTENEANDKDAPQSYESSTSNPLSTIDERNSAFNGDIAHHRKYGQSPTDNKIGSVKNITVGEVNPDIILYYLKNHKNGSSVNSYETSYENSYTKNDKKDEINKSSPNYILNKDGFMMLTKVFHKIPTNVKTNFETSLKPNASGNHSSACAGNIKIKCASGECISSVSRCNHLVDCSDGSDEKNCTCAEYLKAQFLTRKICDGVVDCWDFSDENNCEWCSKGQFVCSNSRVCIDQSRVCDARPDCPNGDDEKSCLSITPEVQQADSINYHSTGILMIRKEGIWGKLCTQHLEEIFKSKWTLADLGKVVCKTMTYGSLENIKNINDSKEDTINNTTYYELLYSNEPDQHKSSRFGLTFGNTDCSQKKVVQVTCSDLECGVRPQAQPHWGRSKRAARHSRIVGGGNAGPGAWPWLAALYKEGEFQCGATLISNQWLLSAGHCFYHAQDEYWVARLGALRRGTNLPSPYEQLRTISQILLHPSYVDSGFINDISLLRLDRPVTLTNYVRPICLPPPGTVLRDGRMCTVIGWGQLFEIGRIFPDTLQEVQLPVISTAECRRRTLFLPLYRVTEDMFCAGYDRGGRDACLGDSGGPLMCQEQDGHWTLMGVTSNGYGCARANRPGVYTKVASYVEWLRESLRTVEEDRGRGQGRGRVGGPSCHGHRCPLGECLPPVRMCNGFVECSDGSDENHCWK